MVTPVGGSATAREVRVLHVIHGLGSGVEAAVLDYALALPGCEHHVVFSADDSCHNPDWAASPAFASAVRVPAGLAGFTRATRARVEEVEPHLVHGHSSVGGAVSRVLVSDRPVVYTPHCFAFLRRDVGKVRRAAFRLAERALVSRTRALAACSPHEAALARGFMRPERVHYVPNVATLAGSPAGRREQDRAASFSVVTSGRVSPQKGVHAFTAMALELRRRGADVDLTWIGAGDEALTQRLGSAGVTVTGWLTRERAVEVMTRSDLYVHSATWEAAPLTVLEAAQADVPVLARDSPPLRSLGIAPLWTTVADLVDRIEGLMRGEGGQELSELNHDLRSRHTPRAQAEALAACYRSALGDGAPSDSTDSTPRTVKEAS